MTEEAPGGLFPVLHRFTKRPAKDRTMKAITLLPLLAVLLFKHAAAMVPVTGPASTICGGQTSTGAGGQFGYSVAMSDGTANVTYMVVSKPWDSTVHVYMAGTPTRTYDAVSGTPLPVAAPSWAPAGSLQDQTYSWSGLFDPRQGAPAFARSYFGHSVDISSDGSRIAVGIPGRNKTSYWVPYTGVGTNTSLNFAPFHGEVKVFTRPSSTLRWDSPLVTNQTLTMPPLSYKLKFGHQVKFSGDSAFLFVAANAGWDGVWIDTAYNVNLGCQMSSFGTNTYNMTGANVYIYNKAADGTYTVGQTLAIVSPVPFGQAGVRMDSFGSGNKTILMVRAFKRNTNLQSTSGGVTVYTLGSDGLFALSNSYYNRPITDAVSTGSWTSEDWFGYAVSAGYDPQTDRLIMAVGAPRSGSVLYTLRADGATGNPAGTALNSSAPWTSVAMTMGMQVTNDAYVARNFFGGFVRLSADARFLYVGDATNTNGRGQVQVFMLRNGTVGNIAALGYESVVIPSVPAGYTAASAAGLPYIYDHITTLAGNVTDYVIGQNASLPATLFRQDSFGKEIASNMYWTAVGAPAGDCVYSYNSLLSYVVPAATADTGNSTNAAPTNAGTGNTGQADKNALYIGLGAGLGIALLAIPSAFYGLRSQHKKKLIARLEAQKALAQLNANPWENPALPGAGGEGIPGEALAGASNNARLVG